MSKESKHTIKVIHWTAKEDYGEGGKGGRDRNGEREVKRGERGRGGEEGERRREMAVWPSLLIITLNVKELNLPIKK